MPKTYLTHDNGGRAFEVDLSYDKINVYRMVQEHWDSIPERGKKIIETKYTKKWIGDNLLNDSHYERKGKWSGNSILIELTPGYYIHVGIEVFYFETRNHEPILKYVSPVGNNDVPYPYAIGKKYTYFMLDKKTVPNNNLNLKKDGYHQFYGHSLRDQPEQRQKVEKSKKKFRIKTLAKRM